MTLAPPLTLAAPLTPTKPQKGAGARARLDVEILSIATANPTHRMEQRESFERAKKIFPHLARQEAIFHNTGIRTRYTCEPYEWYERTHGWEDRTEAFQQHAVALLAEVAEKAVADAGLTPREIDVLVVNTITGLAIPSLDARLMNRLAFRRNIERLPMFGFGCGGGVAGLARAARLAQGMPGAHILFLTVDLCSLCFRPNDPSVAMFISTALFGDGAAGVVLRHAGDDDSRKKSPGHPNPRIHAVGEHFWSDSERIMGWDIKEDGFGLVLSPELPSLVRREFRPALDGFLQRAGLHLDDFEGFLVHPGSSKVLETVEEVLGIQREQIAHSWEVLRDYGNMSSASALFVLKRAVASGARRSHLLAAFGPGFSAYFVAIELF